MRLRAKQFLHTLKKFSAKLLPDKLFSKKPLLLGFLLTVCLMLFLPWTTINAIEPITTAAVISSVVASLVSLGVGLGIMAGLLGLFIGLSYALLLHANDILTWVIHNPFNMAMTNPNGNIIIELGWTLTRDLTNMMFILGLAYIGLATALNIAGFDTKKTFVNLLLIALLINFTPIICGAIVDVSNIITGFFVEDVNFESMLMAVNKGWQDMSFFGKAEEFIRHNPTFWVKMALTLSFTFFGGLIILTFAGLFFLRHILIWILVILSPLAFFAWIFSKTKKYFDMWWKQFLMWSFIGVPAGFFLYLGYHLVNEASKRATLTQMTLDSSNGFFNNLAPSIVVLSLLVGGFQATRKLTPMGASAVLGLVGKIKGKGMGSIKKLSKFTGKTFGKTLMGGAGSGQEIAEGIRDKGAAAATGKTGLKRGLAALGGGLLGAGAGLVKTLPKGAYTKQGQAKGARRVVGQAEKMHLVKAGTAEKMMTSLYKTGDAEKRLKTASTTKLTEVLNRRAFSDEAIGAQMAAAKILAERKKLKKDAPTLENIKKIQSLGFNTDDIEDVVPGWAGEFAGKEKLDKKAIALFGTGSNYKSAVATDPANEAKIKDAINADAVINMNPRKFRNVQFKNLGKEITQVDIAKIKDIGRNAKRSEKQDFEKTFLTESIIKMGSLPPTDPEYIGMKAAEDHLLADPNFK